MLVQGGRHEQASATRALPKRRKSPSASPDYYAIPTAASCGAPLTLRYSDAEDISRHAATGEVNGTGIMSSRTSIIVEAKIQGGRQLPLTNYKFVWVNGARVCM